jgi:Protein of unknown function (DUF3574)
MSQFLRVVSVVAIVGLCAGLNGCAASDVPSCAPGLGTASTVFTLFFGKAIPGRGDLTEKEWRAFLDVTVTANLPNGYTFFDANGAWINPATRKTVRETTKVLVVALPDSPDSLMAVNHIRTEYQLKFNQRLVGMTVQRACAAF